MCEESKANHCVTVGTVSILEHIATFTVIVHGYIHLISYNSSEKFWGKAIGMYS